MCSDRPVKFISWTLCVCFVFSLNYTNFAHAADAKERYNEAVTASGQLRAIYKQVLGPMAAPLLADDVEKMEKITTLWTMDRLTLLFNAFLKADDEPGVLGD